MIHHSMKTTDGAIIYSGLWNKLSRQGINYANENRQQPLRADKCL
jgi:hypothetical protein